VTSQLKLAGEHSWGGCQSSPGIPSEGAGAAPMAVMGLLVNEQGGFSMRPLLMMPAANT